MRIVCGLVWDISSLDSSALRRELWLDFLTVFQEQCSEDCGVLLSIPHHHLPSALPQLSSPS